MNEINKTGMKRALLINDLSCIGKCSLGVAVPVVSSFGVEAVPLPTAMLSMQTCFEGYAFCDMTEQMKTFIAHWKKMNVKFDCIFTGFFGNVGQIEMTMDLIRDFSHDDTIVLVDPVIGDNGSLYGFFGEEYIEAMRRLVSMAHVTTPNRTEAALLAGCPMDAPAPAIMDALMSRLHIPNVVITSVAFDGDGNFANPAIPGASVDPAIPGASVDPAIPGASAAPSASADPAKPSALADPSRPGKIGYLARTSGGRFAVSSDGLSMSEKLPQSGGRFAVSSDGLSMSEKLPQSGGLTATDGVTATGDLTATDGVIATGDLTIAKDLRPFRLHGTGDVFASALCGELMNLGLTNRSPVNPDLTSPDPQNLGLTNRATQNRELQNCKPQNRELATPFFKAVRGAADFCDQCVEATIKKQPGHWYGLAYEDVIASKR